MNAVFYLSYTGQSKRIAEYICERAKCPLSEAREANAEEYDVVFFVFPVHCQSLPRAVKSALRRLRAKYLIPVATYGKMCHGDVLRDVSKYCNCEIIAAAYVPTKHSYIADDTEFDDFCALDALFAALDEPKPINIPKSYKNPLSCFFPRLRSRMGVKLYKTVACDGCGACESACDEGAIKNGRPNGKCMRCLKCVAACPHGALRFRCRSLMNKYLGKEKVCDLEIYV